MNMTAMKSLFGLLCMLAAHSAFAAQEFPLYPGAIPNSIDAPDEEALRDAKEIYPFLNNISRPTMTVYLPGRSDAKRSAVIILPGGGYRGVSIVKEGHDVAKQFSEWGVAAFVVKYRTPSPAHMRDHTLGPLQDAQQAIHLVRERAREWNIDPSRVGVMGFSAGGHLASTVGTHFNEPVLPEWQGANLRPDFLMLIYPVITMSPPFAHEGSRKMLLGDAPMADLVKKFSNELAVTAATPRTFLVHAATDPTVPVENSLRFSEALHAQKVATQLMVYPAGGHGFGLNNPTTTDRWMDRCREWMQSQNLLDRE
jgi:acetyl esterase/lipase